MRGDSTRQARASALLHEELARLLSRELGDPRLATVMISRVVMTDDLRLARVYWRSMASASPGFDLAAKRAEIEKGLERASGKLRHAATTTLGLRFSPELRFAYDEGQDARDRIEILLDQVRRETKPPG